MYARLLTIVVWLATISCVTVARSPPKTVKRQGSVCIKLFDYDETMADLRRDYTITGIPDGIESLIGKKLADDDRIIRFEIVRFDEIVRVIFVNVIEKKSNKSHFVRFDVDDLEAKDYFQYFKTINKKEFKKWRAACLDFSAAKRGIYPKPPYCSKDYKKNETMAEFRNFAMAPKEVERFVGKKLADNDSIERYEIYLMTPNWLNFRSLDVQSLITKYNFPDDWTAMFLKVTEKATGKNHFLRLNRPPDRFKVLSWVAQESSEEDFKKWKTACPM